MRNKVGEENTRHMINMMRSLASNLPISPFHLAAADDMESLLNEVLLYRKKKKWVRLTDAEIFEGMQRNTCDLENTFSFEGFVGFVERALRKKNGY